MDRSYTSGFGGSHHGMVRCEGLAKFRRRSDDGRNIGLGVSLFYLCVLAGALVTFLQPYRQIALRACVQVAPRQPSYRYAPLAGPCRVIARVDALDSGPDAAAMRAFDRARKTADASLAHGGQRPRVAMANARILTVARLPRCGILKSKAWPLQRAAVTLAGGRGRPQRAVALAWSLPGATSSSRRKIDIETVS